MLREQINRVLSTIKHPMLKRDLTLLKALHHNGLLDGTLHIELVMLFAWKSGFAVLQESASDGTATSDQHSRYRLEVII